ncbi:MAG: type I methionyl aminopeptidase [Candidatus Omnitrophica bacterium]|nr:type I methionyl aminopeptidase [Candidatus Omnitrophota bacterium]
MNKHLINAGKAAAEILSLLESFIAAGRTGLDINRFIENHVEKYYPGYTLPCKGYGGFPAASCVSINNCIVHGVPDSRIIRNGDLVKVDIVVEMGGWYADSARTYIVGEVPPDVKRLVEVTQKALYVAIAESRPGKRTGDVGYVTQAYVEKEGFSVMRKYCGHGIGQSMHAEPSVPNYGRRGEGPEIKEGMILAVEPMVFMGKHEIKIGPDKWSVLAEDGAMTAHFEHTILVTKGDPVIITA